ncbi:aminoglycoside phosphotransferase family protein [Embleya sp. NPDC008237]|uniref:aminoglycoside phosphotransferase family protein n=1 Tax=Embleya sp. NPDC008237 TaxID=3363978 RepID=UPI0036E53387
MSMQPDPLTLYRTARESGISASGFYNDNVRSETDDGPVIVRIPIHGADGMDLRMWPEHEVIRAVAPSVSVIPAVLHVSHDPAFQIHRFIPGDVLDTIAPRGESVPAHVAGDVVRFFRNMSRVPLDALPALPADWPKDGDTAGFGTLLSAVTADVWRRFREPYASLYAALGVPADPLGRVEADWATMTRRPFRALHCDIHRKNLIVASGRTYFLDWELALWGDPLYDLAVHLHKMDYFPDEAEAVCDGWLAAMPADMRSEALADLPAYIRHERVKSALVDTVRYSKLIPVAIDAGVEERLVGSLTTKINRARAVWGVGGSLAGAEVRRIVSAYGSTAE